MFGCSYSGVKNYHLFSHIFRTESVKYNENYTRAAKRPEVIIRIITHPLYGSSFTCLLHGVKKPQKHDGTTRPRFQGPVGIPRPLRFAFMGV